MTRERTSNGTVPVSIFAFSFLRADRIVKSQNYPWEQLNQHPLCIFWPFRKSSLNLIKDYDLQELQCFDVPERGWNCTAQRILLKLQPLKTRQIAQRFRYRPCQVVPIQPPEGDRHIYQFRKQSEKNRRSWVQSMMLAVVPTSYAVLTGTWGSSVLPDLEPDSLIGLRSPNPCKKQYTATWASI